MTQQGNKLVVIRYDHPQYGTAELSWDATKRESVWIPIDASHLNKAEATTAETSTQDERVFDGEDTEGWMRRSDIDQQGENL